MTIFGGELAMGDMESSTSTPYVTPQSGDAWAADGEQTVVRRRLILLDRQPVELADSYYPAAIATGTALAAPQRIRGGAVTLLADLGYSTADIVEEITARLPDPDEVSRLEIGEHEPLIVLARLSRDAAGTPVEYAVNRMVAGTTPPLVYRTRTAPA
jgi:DNA-binding GntR family transcriptional regulator